MKTIVTATEWDNWFWLRNHGAADPTIKELAEKMWQALQESEARPPDLGESHLPYIEVLENPLGETHLVANGKKLTLEEAIKISTSCCAQVSYRLLDDSIEKAVKIYDQLVTMTPVHASPFEHVATPMEWPTFDMFTESECEHDKAFHFSDLKDGEHLDSKGNFWSGNFKGWEQYRQEIPNNACWDYKGP